MRVLVTGGTGFVGGAVLRRATSESSLQLRTAVRRKSARVPTGIEAVYVSDLTDRTDWSEAVRGVDVVVHAAARVHVMRDDVLDPLTEFRRVNVAGTMNLARQAARAGVRRLVFLSSIKVNGEQTIPGQPFTADDSPAPVDPYGVSKEEAEQALRVVAYETGMEIVIIRPVLAYGPGVKGNFHSMMRWLRLGIPLPLGAVRNLRSLVALDNLVDLILVCLRHPSASSQVFLVSDDEDLSTTELMLRVSKAMNTRPHLVPVPHALLERAAVLLGKTNIAQRLLGNLQVDISKTKTMLEWAPPVSMREALERTVSAIRTE